MNIKKNPIIIILVVLFVASTVYEAINAILDGITRTWSPGNTDLIARAMAASVWLVGVSFAAFIIAIAVSVSGVIGGRSKDPYKVIDGQVSQSRLSGSGYPMLDVPDDEVEFVGMEQHTNAREYEDADL
jgi:hypothetical protein